MNIHSVGAELFHGDGRTDILQQANSRISQLTSNESAWKLQDKE